MVHHPIRVVWGRQCKLCGREAANRPAEDRGAAEVGQRPAPISTVGPSEPARRATIETRSPPSPFHSLGMDAYLRRQSERRPAPPPPEVVNAQSWPEDQTLSLTTWKEKLKSNLRMIIIESAARIETALEWLEPMAQSALTAALTRGGPTGDRQNGPPADSEAETGMRGASPDQNMDADISDPEGQLEDALESPIIECIRPLPTYAPPRSWRTTMGEVLTCSGTCPLIVIRPHVALSAPAMMAFTAILQIGTLDVTSAAGTKTGWTAWTLDKHANLIYVQWVGDLSDMYLCEEGIPHVITVLEAFDPTTLNHLFHSRHPGVVGGALQSEGRKAHIALAMQEVGTEDIMWARWREYLNLFGSASLADDTVIRSPSPD